MASRRRVPLLADPQSPQTAKIGPQKFAVPQRSRRRGQARPPQKLTQVPSLKRPLSYCIHYTACVCVWGGAGLQRRVLTLCLQTWFGPAMASPGGHFLWRAQLRTPHSGAELRLFCTFHTICGMMQPLYGNTGCKYFYKPLKKIPSLSPPFNVVLAAWAAVSPGRVSLDRSAFVASLLLCLVGRQF